MELFKAHSKQILDQLIATHEQQRHEWLIERENMRISHARLSTQYETLEKTLAEKNTLLAQQEIKLGSAQESHATLEKNRVKLEAELSSLKGTLQAALSREQAAKQIWTEESQRWIKQFDYNERIIQIIEQWKIES